MALPQAGPRTSDALPAGARMLAFGYGLERITIDPRVCAGQPTIRGLRITVSVILKTLAAGRTVAEVLAACPELEEQDVR
jgi:uncharacterized protein (DUF433 family)